MKNERIVKLLTLFIFTSIILGSCTKDNINDYIDTQKAKVIAAELPYNLNEYEAHDQVKIVVAEALGAILVAEENLAFEIIQHLIGDNYQTKELLYIQNKNLPLSNGKTLEETLLEKHEKGSQEYNLIKNIEPILPNLVIKIPDWVNPVIENIGLNEMEFAVYPGINTKQIPLIFNIAKNKVRNNALLKGVPSFSGLSEYIPIQVKESEKLVPLKKGTNTTLWNTDLLQDIFPPLDGCSEFVKQKYIVYSGIEYDFLDRITLNDDLLNVRLCGIEIDLGGGQKCPEEPCPEECEVVYQRDCVNEKNVIEGFELANNAVFLSINNQPGGEDVITFHYTFVASGMCGDPNVSQNCPPKVWKLVFSGILEHFYQIQFHRGIPISSEWVDVVFRGNGYYVKMFPKYYDIPVKRSFERIYSQIAYLIESREEDGSWDGNVYGSVVSFSIYEHDDVYIRSTQSQSITITNTSKVSTGLSLGEIFTAEADFSKTVTRTSTYTYNIEAATDVFLGEAASVYSDENFDNHVLFGINKSTGSITTHFAFYY